MCNLDFYLLPPQARGSDYVIPQYANWHKDHLRWRQLRINRCKKTSLPFLYQPKSSINFHLWKWAPHPLPPTERRATLITRDGRWQPSMLPTFHSPLSNSRGCHCHHHLIHSHFLESHDRLSLNLFHPPSTTTNLLKCHQSHQAFLPQPHRGTALPLQSTDLFPPLLLSTVSYEW